jgi:hypothetical protein
MISVLTAQKLKRFGYPQKKSKKFYRKQKNCSVYDILDRDDNYRNEPICYDAPSAEELTTYASENHLLGVVGFFDTSETIAKAIIEHLKTKQ